MWVTDRRPHHFQGYIQQQTASGLGEAFGLTGCVAVSRGERSRRFGAMWTEITAFYRYVYNWGEQINTRYSIRACNLRVSEELLMFALQQLSIQHHEVSSVCLDTSHCGSSDNDCQCACVGACVEWSVQGSMCKRSNDATGYCSQ